MTRRRRGASRTKGRTEEGEAREASCKEYKQCVLIRVPRPDECTIVAPGGLYTPPRRRPSAFPSLLPVGNAACRVYQMPLTWIKLISPFASGGSALHFCRILMARGCILRQQLISIQPRSFNGSNTSRNLYRGTIISNCNFKLAKYQGLLTPAENSSHRQVFHWFKRCEK